MIDGWETLPVNNSHECENWQSKWHWFETQAVQARDAGILVVRGASHPAVALRAKSAVSA